MSQFIKLASPHFNEDDIKDIVGVIKSGNLVQGKKVLELERKICEYIGVSECIAVTNGTSSLHLILESLNIGEGDEVIIPAFSYIATANAVEIVGAKPIFVDIDINSFNIKIDLIEENITNKTKAIMIVHEFGLCADMIEINEMCKKHNIFLIEDAACALGAKQNNMFSGSVGIAGSFSFHPRKAITSGEGGAIVTNDKELALKLRALRNHGIDSQNKSKLDFIHAGYNCRMTDIQAAMLIPQIGRIDNILTTKSLIAKKYLNEIKNPRLKLPVLHNDKKHAWQTFHLLIDNNMSQNEIILQLKNHGIGSNLGAQCMPLQTFYKKKYNLKVKEQYPNALLAFNKGLAIPLYETLQENQINHIIKTLNNLK